MDNNDNIRLNKYLALELGISRREADDYIASGKVTINGATAQLGGRIKQDDIISLSGKTVSRKTAYRYILFNKPVGYVCSRKRQGDNPTIYDLLPRELHSLKPAGRLDRDSSGALILTNDGDFVYHMTHPKFYKTKVYNVTLDHALAPLHQQMIADFGVQLPDGPSKLSLERLNDSREKWQVTMSEGRNRQIRRTFAALGYTVVHLHRLSFGDYSLGDIKPGEYKAVNIR